MGLAGGVRDGPVAGAPPTTGPARYFTPNARITVWSTKLPAESLAVARIDTNRDPFGAFRRTVHVPFSPVVSDAFCQCAPSSYDTLSPTAPTLPAPVAPGRCTADRVS